MTGIIPWPTCNVLLFSLLLLPPLSGSLSAQTVDPHGMAQKDEGRFTIKASAHRPPAINDFGYQDDTEMIEEIALGIQWWTLLGEPIEYYNIKWTASGRYKTPLSSPHAKRYPYIYRDNLKKYPDLLKRYDNLRPADLHLQLTGKLIYDLNDPDTRKWLGMEDGSEYDRQFGHLSHPDFVYMLNDNDLMYTRSGKVGKGIIPSSPRDWHEFLQYEKFRVPEIIPLDINSSFANGVPASSNPAESTKNQRIKYLKESFKHARKVKVWMKIAHVEWPVHEMVEISELFFEYENGEKEPSPVEEVEEKLSEEVEGLEEYNKDDFWGGPGLAKNKEEYKPDLEIIEVSEYHSKFGKVNIGNRVRDNNTGKFVSPKMGDSKAALEIVFDKYIILNLDYISDIDLEEQYKNERDKFYDREGSGVTTQFGFIKNDAEHRYYLIDHTGNKVTELQRYKKSNHELKILKIKEAIDLDRDYLLLYEYIVFDRNLNILEKREVRSDKLDRWGPRDEEICEVFGCGN